MFNLVATLTLISGKYNQYRNIKIKIFSVQDLVECALVE